MALVQGGAVTVNEVNVVKLAVSLVLIPNFAFTSATIVFVEAPTSAEAVVENAALLLWVKVLLMVPAERFTSVPASYACHRLPAAV